MAIGARAHSARGRGAEGELAPAVCEEAGDDGEYVGRAVEQQVTAAVDDVQTCAGHPACDDAGVDEGHDRVVIAVQHQRRLRQAVQPGQAAPPRCRPAGSQAFRSAGGRRCQPCTRPAAVRSRPPKMRPASCSSSCRSAYAFGRANRIMASDGRGPKAPYPVETRPAGRPARGRTGPAPAPRLRRGSPRGHGRARRRLHPALALRIRRVAGPCRAAGACGGTDAGRVEGDRGEPVQKRQSSHRALGSRHHRSAAGADRRPHLHPGRQAVDDVGRVGAHAPHVASGGSLDRRVALAAECLRCRTLVTGPRQHPLRPVRPPGALLLDCAGEPGLGVEPVTGPVRKCALGLPGGLTRCWMCPPPESTKVESPPNCVLGGRPATAPGGRSRRRRCRCRR